MNVRFELLEQLTDQITKESEKQKKKDTKGSSVSLNSKDNIETIGSREVEEKFFSNFRGPVKILAGLAFPIATSVTLGKLNKNDEYELLKKYEEPIVRGSSVAGISLASWAIVRMSLQRKLKEARARGDREEVSRILEDIKKLNRLAILTGVFGSVSLGGIVHLFRSRHRNQPTQT